MSEAMLYSVSKRQSCLNLEGHRFGSLVAVERIRKYSWRCLCDCGTLKIFYQKHLIENAKSCGCRHVGGLVGKTIGNFTAIREFKNKYNQVSYECRCICGKIVKKTENVFREKHTNSCGCIRPRPRKRRLSEEAVHLNKRFHDYRGGAKQRSLDFSLTREEFHAIISKPCHYCAEPPNKKSGVDRKDNSIGYTIENAVPCCPVCNMKKNVTHYDDFLVWVKKIHDNLGLGSR